MDPNLIAGLERAPRRPSRAMERILKKRRKAEMIAAVQRYWKNKPVLLGPSEDPEEDLA